MKRITLSLLIVLMLFPGLAYASTDNIGGKSQQKVEQSSGGGIAGGRDTPILNPPDEFYRPGPSRDPLESNPTPDSGSEPDSSSDGSSTGDSDPNVNPSDEVANDDEGEVLGDTACTEYITEYIHIQKNNNPDEVMKLQLFLNDFLDKTLEKSGIYDTKTFNAVKDFQLIESEEILKPWGITKPTGYVYKTTRRRINNIKCPELDIPMPVWLTPDTNINDNV